MATTKQAAAVLLTTAAVVVGCSSGGSKPASSTGAAAGAGTSATSSAPGGTGGTIAFRRFSDVTHSSSHIVTARLDGSAQRDVTAAQPDVQDGFASWSPDGTRLAFQRTAPRAGCGENCETAAIFVVGASGGPVTQLTPDVACVAAPVHTCDASPAWSPDGRSVAFSRRIGTAGGPSDRTGIWVVGVDGAGAHAVTTQQEPVIDAGPAWSPDGSSIVFERGTEDDNGQSQASSILTVRADGSGERRLTSPPAVFGDHPTWSPDGTKILFRKEPGCPTCQFKPSSLYTIRPDCTGLAPLTPDDPNLQYLSGSWSPDGSMIVVPRVQRGTHGDQAELHLLTADGADQRVVVPNAQWQSAVRWSPSP